MANYDSKNAKSLPEDIEGTLSGMRADHKEKIESDLQEVNRVISISQTLMKRVSKREITEGMVLLYTDTGRETIYTEDQNLDFNALVRVHRDDLVYNGHLCILIEDLVADRYFLHTSNMMVQFSDLSQIEIDGEKSEPTVQVSTKDDVKEKFNNGLFLHTPDVFIANLLDSFENYAASKL